MKKIRSLVLCFISIILFFLTGCQNTAVKDNSPVKIGISWERIFPSNEIPEDTQVYIDSIKKVGAIPILLPQIHNEQEAMNALKTVDAVILTGGEDINPTYYSEKPHKNLENLKHDRDTSDYWLLKVALKEDYPILGTCRGMQFLNVVLGGTLYQDLPTEYISNVLHRDPKKIDFTYHPIKITNKNSKLYDILRKDTITVNSWHHQALERLGKGLNIVATAPDNIIEAVELDNSSFVLGVQFHPEWYVSENDNEFILIFEALKKAGLKNRQK
nr:gamma-glutamyl-gamma-aminobutyrate hydrolase family protein [uncultured Cetobacterium sp.]